VGFKIFAATIIASDKMIAEKPGPHEALPAGDQEDLRVRARQSRGDLQAARREDPEVALDDCLGSVRATLTFVYNDHSQQYGWGKESPDRLDFT
jgi:NitT/TauT family transport system substrate-binding protein